MTQQTWLGHPRGLATLFFTEMWERFSYYGMRAILILAMVASVETGGLGLDDRTATAVYGLYIAGVYVTSLPGGWIADRLIGLQNGVWYGGWIIAMGHFSMAIPSTPMFFIGMMLISIGTGLLKPNVSAMVGELYRGQASERRDAAYSLYYMGINIGGFAGPLVCGTLGEKVGWHWGFGAAGVLMLLGLLQFHFTKQHLGHHGVEPSHVGSPEHGKKVHTIGWSVIGLVLAVLAAIALLAITGSIVIDPVSLSARLGGAIAGLGIVYFAYVLIFGGLTASERGKVGVIAILFLSTAVFWSGFEQTGASMNLFAERYTDRVMFGWEMPTSWLQSVNSLFIILLAPFFAALWLRLGARNLDPSTPIKFGLGLIQLGLGFVVMAVASRFVVDGDKVLPTWLVLTYLLHTTGELCLSPVGMSAVTKLAPERYVGQMMGTWFLGTALGNLVAGLIAGHLGGESVAEMPHRFMMVFGFTAGVGVLLLFATPLIKKMMGEVK